MKFFLVPILVGLIAYYLLDTITASSLSRSGAICVAWIAAFALGLLQQNLISALYDDK